MGAMKRLLEAVYETLQETEGFRLLGMDQKWAAAESTASEVLRRGPSKTGIEAQVLEIVRERGM